MTTTTTPIQLTLEQYKDMPKADRQLLRRLAFGMKGPKCFTTLYDLNHLRALLVAENEATGEFPEKWTDTVEDDEQ